jgi:hypothetical protein
MSFGSSSLPPLDHSDNQGDAQPKGPPRKRTPRTTGAAPKSIGGIKIVPPTVQPIKPEPDTWYGATYCGDWEIILTTHNGLYFYLHGDENVHSCASPSLVIIKKFGKRVVKHNNKG